jgi:ferric-dicitrate binding protein FerR (iron transport regulator)
LGLSWEEHNRHMTGRRRHLFAALGLAALAAACFGLLTWALVEGSAVAMGTS